MAQEARDHNYFRTPSLWTKCIPYCKWWKTGRSLGTRLTAYHTKFLRIVNSKVGPLSSRSYNCTLDDTTSGIKGSPHTCPWSRSQHSFPAAWNLHTASDYWTPYLSPPWIGFCIVKKTAMKKCLYSCNCPTCLFAFTQNMCKKSMPKKVSFVSSPTRNNNYACRASIAPCLRKPSPIVRCYIAFIYRFNIQQCTVVYGSKYSHDI